MSESERRVTGLREYAEGNLFADWRVTPPLRERVRERVRQAGERRRSRAWLAPAATAIAGLALFALLGRVVGGMVGEVSPAAKGSSAQVPDRIRPAATASNGPVLELDRLQFTVQVADEAGAPVKTTTAYSMLDADTHGNSVGAASVDVVGVEVQPGKKLILNGDYTVKVRELQPALAALQQLTAARGGYVAEMTVNRGDNGSAAARVVLRLPAERFGEAADAVDQLGEVERQQVWSQDVTDQFIDNESRLKVLTEHEQKLQELARTAANFDDWLQLAKQINETRTQIEALQGRLKQLANQVEYSTLNIALVQPAPGQESVAVAAGQGIGAQMAGAFRESVGLLGGLARWTLVGLSAAAPFLLPAGLVGGVVWLGLRRRRKA